MNAERMASGYCGRCGLIWEWPRKLGPRRLFACPRCGSDLQQAMNPSRPRRTTMNPPRKRSARTQRLRAEMRARDARQYADLRREHEQPREDDDESTNEAEG